MTQRINKLMRGTCPWLAAGVLLQAGGCSVNLNELAAGLATSIANTLVSDLVFGVFNVGF